MLDHILFSSSTDVDTSCMLLVDNSLQEIKPHFISKLFLRLGYSEKCGESLMHFRGIGVHMGRNLLWGLIHLWFKSHCLISSSFIESCRTRWWLGDLNPESKVVLSETYVVPFLKDMMETDFIWNAFIVVDKDSSPEMLVFKWAITLQDTYWHQNEELDGKKWRWIGE